MRGIRYFREGAVKFYHNETSKRRFYLEMRTRRRKLGDPRACGDVAVDVICDDDIVVVQHDACLGLFISAFSARGRQDL